jgi:hypothetical protein
MNQISNIHRVLLRGGPLDGMMVDCADDQDEIRQPFATANLLPLMKAGLPLTNAVVVAVVAVYWDVASELERKARPVRKFDFVELQDT